MKAGYSNKSIKIKKWLRQSLWAYQDGDLKRSKGYCKKVFKLDASNADAFHLMGINYIKDGRFDDALSMVDNAIKSDVTFSDFHRTRARILTNLNRSEDALLSYRKAISINPEDDTSVYETGALYQQLKKFESAFSCYQKCLELNPKFSACYNNLGLIYKHQENYEKAISSLLSAVEIDPSLKQAYNNLGIIYKDVGEVQQAIKSFSTAIKLSPNYAEAFFNMGVLLDEIGRFEAAINCFNQVVRIDPGFNGIYNNFGIVFQKMGRTEDAVRCLNKAIELEPDNAYAFHNIGIIFFQNNKLQLAIDHTKQAIKLTNGEKQKYYYNLFEQLRAASCWDELVEIEKRINAITINQLDAEKIPDESPFLALTRSEDRQRNLRIASKWSASIRDKTKRFHRPFQFQTKSKNRIIIGFLSNRFRNAATGHLMAGMFKYFDKNSFETHCYSWGEDDNSYFRKTIENSVDRFIDITNLGFFDAAYLIHKNKVDILFDLKGFTRNNRMEICSLKPAPIQIAYMNFNGTSGSNYYDYLMADSIVIPESHLNDYSEKIIYMPNTFMVADNAIMTHLKKKTRRSEDLPEDKVILCSFNQAYKIEAELFDCWMTVLKEVPESILWMIEDSDLVVENLKHRAIKKGVDPNRIIFSRRMDKLDHLSRLQLADLALDTWTCNGHTSTVDALLAGVPVVTKMGNHFASRVSASILKAIGLDSMISTGKKEYQNIIIEKARDRNKLSSVKLLLGNFRTSQPLFDTKRFVRSLEYGLREIWAIYRSGDKAQNINISDMLSNK
ncbi:tetratricopeptide repeat protein [Desulfosarcina ovata]|nr:glycosyltransferase family 41 protein [Desulfosarcina ovata]